MEYETPIIECAHKTVNVERKPTWSDFGQDTLLNEVNLRKKRLFGKFKGSGREKKGGGEEWKEATRAINEHGSFVIFFIRLSIIIVHEKSKHIAE